MSTYYEMESLPQLEVAYEAEWEGETPGTFESEMFFQELSGAARRGASVPSLQRLAMASARAALRQGGDGDGFDSLAFDGQSETEGAFEVGMEAGYEAEMEQAVHEMQRFPSTALMEHLGHAAAEAETEGESFAFLAPLIPMAAKLAAPLLTKGIGLAAKVGGKMAAKVLPKLASQVMQGVTKSVPQMTKSLQGVARTLHRNPRTRPLMRTLPRVAQRATADLARQVARGRRVTPRAAAQAVARQAAQVIGNPQQAVRAWQGSQALDRKYHDASSSAMPPPTVTGAPAAASPNAYPFGLTGDARRRTAKSSGCCCRCGC